jgi:hypothetical protein
LVLKLKKPLVADGQEGWWQVTVLCGEFGAVPPA